MRTIDTSISKYRWMAMLAVFCISFCAQAWAVRAGEEASYASELGPFLSQYCFACHGEEKQKAQVNFASYGSDRSLVEDRKFWQRVREVLLEREMPPENKPQPSEEERRRVTDYIQTALDKFDCSGPVDPGRVTLRRLNREEYRNTIRDLVGVDYDPTADFPVDEVGYGFDNIGDVLSLPPMLMEKYLAAAERVAEMAVDADYPPPSDTHARLFICNPAHGHSDACADRILRHFAAQAWRRPVTAEEVERLVGLVKMVEGDGGSFVEGIRLAVQAVLVSPHFLFRWELDPELEKPSGVRELNDYELASRLSYFLWSSLPDEPLFALAQAGALQRPGVLESEVARMLQDPKSRALVQNFGGQWLQIRNLAGATPDPTLFPAFDDALRQAMRMETELFFETVMKEDLSVLEFISSNFTFLNERLARHYGLKGVEGESFRRVQLEEGHPRGGVLTHASILTITSNPTRTSPVSRGKWILEQILGTPPPPPPPNVPELVTDQAAVQSTSLRERMELHRAKPECATCHTKMDALGFAFENFDAIGAWRTQDGSAPIDPSGVLPDGRSFNGPVELKQILRAEDTFVRCLAEKMLIYALGRGLAYYDKCAVDDAVAALQTHDHKFSSLVTAIVTSDPFRKKRIGDGPVTARLLERP